MPLSVLLIEDDAVAAMDLQAVLHRAGHSVIGTAPTFDRALQIATARRPDVAVVDYRLGGQMDGVMIARHLRRLGAKVVYVTGYASEVRLIDPAATIVSKPYQPEALLRAVQQAAAADGDSN